MRVWRFGTFLVVCSFATAPSVLAQATAEAALAHALSSTAGSSVGTALGKATNQLSGKLGQQVSRTTPRQPNSTASATRAPKTTTASTTSASSNGPLIASIQGGEPAENPCTPVADAKPAASDSKSQPGGELKSAELKSPTASQTQPNCQTIKPTEAYQSVINLPAAK